MRYVVEIEIDNEAFKPDAGVETANILHLLADRLDDQDTVERSLFDRNGNKVGRAYLARGKVKWRL